MLKNLIEIQKELKAPKGQYNSFGKYKYRSAEDILEAVKPLCHERGCLLVLSDELVSIGTRYYVKATASFCDPKLPDQTLKVTAYAREDETKKGMDGSQITGTASSYARKYALNGLFCIDDAKDADTDAYRNQQDNAQPEPQPQQVGLVDQIRQLAQAKGVQEIEICNQGGVTKIEDMPPSQMQACINWLAGM